MTAKIIYSGPWQVPKKVIDCLCPDGKRRVAILGKGDTWFSISARIKAYGKTVTGYVTARDTEETDYEFRPYLYRKNYNVFTPKELMS